MDLFFIVLVGVLVYNIIPIICYTISVLRAKNNGTGKVAFWIGFAAGVIPLFGNIAMVVREETSFTSEDHYYWIFFALITIVAFVLRKQYLEDAPKNQNAETTTPVGFNMSSIGSSEKVVTSTNYIPVNYVGPLKKSENKRQTVDDCCAYCGAKLEAGHMFCRMCGKPVTISQKKDSGNSVLFCRKCGAQMPSDSLFCPKCGERNVSS